MRAHTDIIADGWAGAAAQAGWRPYALLARLDRPIGAWLLFLPGLWGILLARPGILEAIRLVVLFGVGAVVMRSAGCVVNDLWDRDLDRKVVRTRGPGFARLRCAGGPRQALGFPAALAGRRVGHSAATECAVLGVGRCVAGAGRPVSARQTGDLVATAYDGSHLRLWRACSATWPAPDGSMPPWWRCTARRFCGIWASTRSTPIRIVRTTHWPESAPPRGCSANGRPRSWRHATPARWCLLAIAGWLAGPPGFIGQPGFSGLSVWFYPALLVPAALLLRQVMVLDIDDPGVCLRLFRANREVGLAVGAAILLGWL